MNINLIYTIYIWPKEILCFEIYDKKIQSLPLKSLERLFYVLVVGVVGEVVEVVFDGHEQARESPAAPQLGGEDDARDQVVCSWVGRWDGPKQLAVFKAP